MKGFITYSTYRITDNKPYIHLFGRLENGDSFQTISEFKPFFYIKTIDLEKAKEITELRTKETNLIDFKKNPVVKIIVELPGEVALIRQKLEDQKIECYEADVKFTNRFLIEHNIKSSLDIEGEYKEGQTVNRIYTNPKLKGTDYLPTNLKTLSFDIEASPDLEDFYCIALKMADYSNTLIVSEKEYENTESFQTEADLLKRFKELIVQLDPDIITGWNVIDFDLNYLRQRFRKNDVHFIFGRTDWECKLRIESEFVRTSKAEIPGRAVLDGINILKESFIRLDDYKLNTAAHHFLNDSKLIQSDDRGEEIRRLYNEDQEKLIAYNLKDAKLVLQILEESKALNLTIQRSLLTGMPLDRVSATVASLDYVYLSECRKNNYAAYSTKFNERTERIKGGYVRESKPGIYNNILVMDFKSLYPSLIRTFNIDPVAFAQAEDNIITAPNGAKFSKEEGLLPKIIQRLWKNRDLARKDGNELARYAIKILMNSFFGALANPSSRYYSLDMANAITHFGQHIIKLTSKLIEQKNLEVLYNDTDSIFINTKQSLEETKEIGKQLQDDINNYYKKHVKEDYDRTSYLELEYEKIYTKFLMPQIRGSDVGAKKRYAGILIKEGKEVMDFVGLEFVRRDWTEIAKKFQLELLSKIFHGAVYEEYVQNFVADIKDGKYDDLLIYKKAIRKDLDEYTKTTPPHVKAAKLLGDELDSSLIKYYITVNGPEPLQKHKSPIDYAHYIEKQIKPIADAILTFSGKNFDDIIMGRHQKSLMDF
jgi:DNA polymerase II